MYEDLIMEHIKNARNFRVLEDANRNAHGFNPLCGDDFNVYVYVHVHDGTIDGATFQCECCGVSMASASIMTELVKDIPVTAAHDTIREFTALLRDPAAAQELTAGQLSAAQRALLDTVRNYPARTRCAILPWNTLDAALSGQTEASV